MIQQRYYDAQTVLQGTQYENIANMQPYLLPFLGCALDSGKAGDPYLAFAEQAIEQICNSAEIFDPRDMHLQVTNFAQSNGYPLAQCANWAFRLRDVGKLNNSISPIVAVSRSLTPDEESLVAMHPRIGANYVHMLLESLKCPSQIVDEVCRGIALHHLPAAEIDKTYQYFGNPTLLPKIIGIWDTFSALTSERPYRTPPVNNALSFSKALEVMSQMKGQFDPVIFNSFKTYVLNLNSRL